MNREQFAIGQRMKNDVTAIILSGGQGIRFGGKDKGLLEWQGKPLIQHVVERLKPQVANITINCNRNIETYKALGFTVSTDLNKDYLGPLAGIQAAAQYIDTPWCLVCANDTPLLPDDLVDRLWTVAQQTQSQIAYPLCKDRHHYLPALIETKILVRCGDYLSSGGRSLKSWYQDYRVSVADYSLEPGGFINVNNATTLAQLPGSTA